MPRLFPILLSLPLALLSTISIAWALACTNIPTRGIGSAQTLHPTRGQISFSQIGTPPGGLKVTAFLATGRVSITAHSAGPDFPLLVGSPAYFYQSVPTPPDELIPRSLRSITIPWLTDPATTLWPRGGDMDWREIEASGFPFLALASIKARTPTYTREQTWSLPLPTKHMRRMGEQAFGPYSPCTLPLRPLFPGFLLNTALFAALWYPILLIPAALRRQARRKRNQCPHCGYSRVGLAPQAPCPECGQPRPTTPTSTPN